MDELMSGLNQWMNEWTNGQTDGRWNRWIDDLMDE